MFGYVNGLNEMDDELNEFHRNNIISTVSYDNCLMLPFDKKEIEQVYKYGTSVIGYINGNNNNNKLGLELCKLNRNIENIDIICANQSFINEYKRFVKIKCITVI